MSMRYKLVVLPKLEAFSERTPNYSVNLQSAVELGASWHRSISPTLLSLDRLETTLARLLLCSQARYKEKRPYAGLPIQRTPMQFQQICRGVRCPRVGP